MPLAELDRVRHRWLFTVEVSNRTRHERTLDDRTRFLARQMIGNNPNPGTGVKCHEVDSTLSTSTSSPHASEALLLSFSPRDSGNFRTLISSRLISESQPVPKEYSKRLEDHLYPDA